MRLTKMRLPLAWLLVSTLIICEFALIEARYWTRDSHKDLLARHRHRHGQHEPASRWNHNSRKPSWDDDDVTYDDDDTWKTEEDDYEDYYPRKRSDHRHPTRLHRPSHRWQHHLQEDTLERRRNSWYSNRNHRVHPSNDWTYRKDSFGRSRSEDDLDNEDFDALMHRKYYIYEDKTDRSSRRWSSFRKHKMDVEPKGHRSRDWRLRVNDEEDDRKRNDNFDYIEEQKESRAELWKKLFRGNLSTTTTTARNNFKGKFDDAKTKNRHHNNDDYYLAEYDDEVDKENENALWKKEDNKEEEKNEEYDESEDDNDLDEKDTKPPLKTFDDIIERLTSGDSSTSRSHLKRDSRNLEIAKYLKRDVYGNLRYEPSNISGQAHDPFRSILLRKEVNVTTENVSSHSLEMQKSQNVEGSRKSLNTKKSNAPLAQTKNLDSDYEEYVNGDDNEKEEDLGQASLDEDTAMQADVTNTDYTQEDNGDDEEEELPVTGMTTVATTTTTTVHPLVTMRYNYRDLRAYDSSTGSQYNGYQSKNDYPPMSAHSVHKWQTLGTRESVKETRGNMQQFNKNGKTAEIREALQHAIKVSREGSCQWPRARVIPVRDVYPSPSTTYIPHCAILHRCSDDTGCCRSEALTCVPKHSHRVELYFYTTSVEGASVVEKLSFYNHTECECRERTEYDTMNDKLSEKRFYRHQSSSPPPQNIRRPPQRKPCRCPSEFTPRITSKGECQCNCYQNDEDCIRARRGKVFFSLTDRICIQNETCATPTCEFGDYMKLQGKCPRKRDRFDAIANYHHTNLSHRFHRS